jgi:8-oxo-dGTP pyrophosphatase MutT (NUDIX family)
MEEKIQLNAVLVFPVWLRYVLLARKKSKIGAGCLNGYGGGINPGEDVIAACVRECVEEAGITLNPRSLEYVACLDFYNEKRDGTFSTCRVNAFLAYGWDGYLQETSEMGNPEWYRFSRLPLSDMMPADREWFPAVLQGKKVRGEFWYGPFQKELICPSVVEIVSTLE